MKLGASKVNIKKESKLFSIYKETQITERHRSKYSFDQRYTDSMTEHGLISTASAASDGQTEAFEWRDHPFGIGVQFHPEFVSRPFKPHPLFTAFIRAAMEFHK